MEKPNLAKSAKIIRRGVGGPYEIEIDGQRFPWATTGGVNIKIEKSDLTVLTLGVAIEGAVSVEVVEPERGVRWT
jgi:hypothetical protein